MEVCHINIWGTVCGDSDWGLAAAHVTCRQLGLPTTGATTITLPAVPGTTRVSWLSNVRCVGTESSVFYCNTALTGNKYCSSTGAGVSCQESKS